MNKQTKKNVERHDIDRDRRERVGGGTDFAYRMSEFNELPKI